MDNDRKNSGQPPVSDEEWKNPQTQMGAIAGLNLNNPKELIAIGGEEGTAVVELLARKKAEQAQAQAAKCPPSEGVFHAYAVQSGNPQAPRYAVTFANPTVANEYAAQLSKDYPNVTTRKWFAADAHTFADPIRPIRAVLCHASNS
jgi:hypothetical protein